MGRTRGRSGMGLGSMQLSWSDEQIKTALQRQSPGRAAQLRMAVRPRPGDRRDLPDPCPHEAAVLILLYERQGQLVFPLTLRTQTVEIHRGQISLPGGSREAQDANLQATALRETAEELGVGPSATEVVGNLSPLFIPASGFCVYPYVACVRPAPVLRPDPREVAQVFEVAISHLLDPRTRRFEIRQRDGQRFRVPAYRIGDRRIWGATAMILAELVAVLRAQS